MRRKTNIMRFTGKITTVLPLAEGTSEKGSKWKRQTIVVTDDDPNACYPDEIVADLFNDKIPEKELEVGQHVDVFYSMRRKEINNRLYNDISVFRVIER